MNAHLDKNPPPGFVITFNGGPEVALIMIRQLGGEEAAKGLETALLQAGMLPKEKSPMIAALDEAAQVAGQLKTHGISIAVERPTVTAPTAAPPGKGAPEGPKR